jgi:hypothetical protein
MAGASRVSRVDDLLAVRVPMPPDQLALIDQAAADLADYLRDLGVEVGDRAAMRAVFAGMVALADALDDPDSGDYDEVVGGTLMLTASLYAATPGGGASTGLASPPQESG